MNKIETGDSVINSQLIDIKKQQQTTDDRYITLYGKVCNLETNQNNRLKKEEIELIQDIKGRMKK
jgi:ferredoxin-fold anticodon binding domain-containing protein